MASKSDLGKSCPTKYSDIRQQCRRHVCILQKSEPYLCGTDNVRVVLGRWGKQEKWLEELVHQTFPLQGSETQLHGNCPHTSGIIGLMRSWDGPPVEWGPGNLLLYGSLDYCFAP